jgi:alpha-glucosidase
VIYQIYPRSFQDGNGDGIGDLQGIIERLDYLAGVPGESLGIDAVWISPFYPSPMDDFGYDVAEYCDVDPIFGDVATFDRLLDAAHRRGMRVIVDYVPNHTSDQHPWFADSRSGQNSDKRDWYIWRDPKPDGSLPNNWGSPFGGPSWTLDPATGQCFLHQFLPSQPELNWRNPQVEEAMFDVLRFWLDRGADGFRMDVIGMIVKDAMLRDNPPHPDAPADLPTNDTFGRQLHLHNEDQDDVHEILRRMRALLDGYDDVCAIGELGYSLERWARYYGEDDELHLPFNFRLMGLPWKAEAIRASVEALEAALPARAWPTYVLGSHDATRLASRVGPAQARIAAVLLLTLRGTPTLYQGDELGMVNGAIPEDRLRDPQGLRLGAARSRDPARTPMQWLPGARAGFSSVDPWLPIAPDHQTRNVAVQAGEPRSMLNLYRSLLRYRRVSPALTSGSYERFPTPEGCFAYLRRHPAGDCLVALNFTSEPLRIDTGSIRGSVILSTHLDRGGSVTKPLRLRPDEGLIIEVEP